jgi:hypothetical protein
MKGQQWMDTRLEMHVLNAYQLTSAVWNTTNYKGKDEKTNESFWSRLWGVDRRRVDLWILIVGT